MSDLASLRGLLSGVKFLGYLIIILSDGVQPFHSLEELYKVARQQRILAGHAAAQSLHAEILRRNPSDLTTSTRLAAANGTLLQCQQRACRKVDAELLSRLKQWFLDSNFTKAGVDDVLNIMNSHACAPIYITPASAGQVEDFPFSDPDAACILTALFLLGIAVPIDIAQSCCSEEKLQLLFGSGLVSRCDYNDSLLLGVVEIMPIDLSDSTCLYIVTDWHPRVLNSIGIEMDSGTIESAVMYIGPDSLALIQHWILHPDLKPGDSLLDLCTGSGVQALAALATHRCRRAVCVDTSQRALRFASFSAALNGLSLTCVQGDLLDDEHNLTHVLVMACGDDEVDAGYYDFVTANPPFLPVPDKKTVDSRVVETIVARHGLFSAGGPKGEDVLARILSLSSTLLKNNGYAGIVSEFFFSSEKENINSVQSLLQRLMFYWTRTRESKGLLLTNEFPISALTYSQRRSETDDEARVWKGHLEKQDIAACSPGLLYVQKLPRGGQWKHSIVPKSEYGSIWTPSNPEAIRFTQETSRDFFGLLVKDQPIAK